MGRYDRGIVADRLAVDILTGPDRKGINAYYGAYYGDSRYFHDYFIEAADAVVPTMDDMESDVKRNPDKGFVIVCGVDGTKQIQVYVKAHPEWQVVWQDFTTGSQKPFERPDTINIRNIYYGRQRR